MRISPAELVVISWSIPSLLFVSPILSITLTVWALALCGAINYVMEKTERHDRLEAALREACERLETAGFPAADLEAVLSPLPTQEG